MASSRRRSIYPDRTLLALLEAGEQAEPGGPTNEERIAWFRAERAQALPAILHRAGVEREHCRAAMGDFSDGTVAQVRTFLAKRSRVWRLEGVRERLQDLPPADEWTGTPHGLVITGPPGTGKTRLAVAILASLVTKATFAVEFYHARALMRRLWSVYRDDAKEREEDVLRDLCECPVLVIDDLGHEGRVSEAAIGALHEILSDRIGEFRTTIITTNCTEAQLAKVYDEAIASRLAAWDMLVLTGDDRRRA